MLKARNNLLGLALAYTASPLLTLRHHGEWWFMLRDSPQMACAFLACGLFFWIYGGYYLKSRSSGL